MQTLDLRLEIQLWISRCSGLRCWMFDVECSMFCRKAPRATISHPSATVADPSIADL